jgi:hypothetical protein
MAVQSRRYLADNVEHSFAVYDDDIYKRLWYLITHECLTQETFETD